MSESTIPSPFGDNGDSGDSSTAGRGDDKDGVTTEDNETSESESSSSDSTRGAGREIQQSSSEAHSHLSYGMAAMQGRRREMQDGHAMLPEYDLGGTSEGVGFFAIFDGHGRGGEHLAHLCETEIPERLRAVPDVSLDPDVLEAAIDTVFQTFDKELIEDRHSLGIHPGTTAVVVVVTPRHIVTGWAGDSRALLGRRSGGFDALTDDHLIKNPAEYNRIRASGADLESTSGEGGWRVHGLNMSRSIGDIEAKLNEKLPQDQQSVIAKPDTSVHEKNDDVEFLVLCCDGIFEVMDNKEVVDFVRSRLHKHMDLEDISRELILACYDGGSGDNMSAMVVTFPSEADSRSSTSSRLGIRFPFFRRKSDPSSSSDSTASSSDEDSESTSGVDPHKKRGKKRKKKRRKKKKGWCFCCL